MKNTHPLTTTKTGKEIIPVYNVDVEFIPRRILTEKLFCTFFTTSDSNNICYIDNGKDKELALYTCSPISNERKIEFEKIFATSPVWILAFFTKREMLTITVETKTGRIIKSTEASRK